MSSEGFVSFGWCTYLCFLVGEGPQGGWLHVAGTSQEKLDLLMMYACKWPLHNYKCVLRLKDTYSLNPFRY